ncbi:MAG: PKD-like domain-containing protein, partial [Bacteroidales bacterium]
YLVDESATMVSSPAQVPTFAWTRDETVSVTGIADSGTGNISGTMRNLTDAPVVVTFTITPTSGAGCDGDDITATVTVNPEPVATAIPDEQTICSNVPFLPIVLDTNNGLGGTTFSWTRDETSTVTGMNSSGTGDIISGTLRNFTSDPVTVTFTITPTSDLGCAGDPITAEVTVNPEPIAQADPSNQSVCSNTPITDILLSASNGVAGTTFSWSRDNTALVTGMPGTGNGDISGTLVNQTNSPIMVTFTITPESGAGCTGDDITAQVTVNPEPVGVATPAVQEICSNSAMEQIVMSTSNNLFGTSYAWTRDETATVTGIADSGSGNITGVPVNTTNAPVTVTFTITPTSGAGCVGGDFIAELTVKPEPVATATPDDQTVCTGDVITEIVMGTSNGVVGTTYSWTRDNPGIGGSIGMNGTGNISGTLENSGTSPVTVTFEITPEYDGCPGATITAQVTVRPNINISTQPVSQTVCEGDDVTFAVTAGSVDSYQWQLYNEGTGIWEDIAGEEASDITVTNAGYGHDGNLYRVEMTGCNTVTSDPAELNIHPDPEITIQPEDYEACEGAQAVFEVSAGGVGLQYRWLVDRNDGLGFVEVANTAGQYQGAATSQLSILNTTGKNGYLYQLRITDMCGKVIFSDEALLSLSIDPVITTQPVGDEICEDGTTTFTAVVDGDPAVLLYQWQYMPEGGSSWQLVSGLSGYEGASTTELTILSAPVSFDGNSYRLRVVNTLCGTDVISDEVLLTVNANPVPSILPDPAAVSVENTLTLDGNPQGGSGTYDVHLWSGPAVGNLDEDDIQTPVFTPTATGMFDLTYTVTDDKGCSGLDNVTVTVTSGIDIELDDEEVCADSDLQLIANASGGSSVYISHEWTGDGAVYLSDSLIRNPVFNSPDPGDYSLTYTVTDDNGTWAMETITVTVFERPVTAVSGDGQFPLVCGGSELQLNGNPSGGSGDYPTHQWTGQTMPLSATDIENPVFRTIVKGEYTISYRVTDSRGCVSDIEEVTIINEIPNASFSSDAVPGCTPMEVEFTNNSLDAVAYEWDFGDGSDIVTDEDPVHIFENLTTTIQYYTVTLTAFSENGCEHSTSQTITVYPGVDSQFTASEESACSPAAIEFGAVPGALEYYWNFDDGEEGAAGAFVLHQFTNVTDEDRVFNVKLRTTSFYGCTDESEKEILIYATPRAEFSADPPLQRFPESTVNFTNIGSSGAAFSYLWEFGDDNTSTQENPSHTYQQHGEYEVTLTVSNENCETSVTRTITVQPPFPVADFNEVAPDCSPHTVSFVNNSEYGIAYRWEFGDGAMSTEAEPTHTYHAPGEYRIKLTVYGDGNLQDEKTSFVTVYVSPIAFLNVAPTFVYAGDQHVATFNLSQDGDTYLWDFGDGTTSNEYEPIHVYMEPGIFDVSLEVWTEDGCHDKFVKEEAVEVDKAGGMTYPTGFRPGNEPTGGQIDPSAPEYERNKVFAPGMSEKVDEYHLMIYNRWGELLFESYDINVGWDGFVKGVKAKQDVYIWKVTGKYTNGESFVMAGDITLLR